MPFPKHALTAVRRSLAASACRGALALALLAMLGSSALAQTYYVSNAAPCVATPDGTEVAPYCTIGAAMAAHHGPGVTIVVKPGTYREQGTVNDTGAPGQPFVFRASGPGVIIEGADNFANSALWAQSAGTSWVAASVAAAPIQVFADGVRLTVTTALPADMPLKSFRFVLGEGLYVNLGGDSPALHGVLVGKRSHGFNMYSKSFVIIDGFQIQHQEQRGVNLQNPTSDIVVSNNTVMWTGSYGIQTINGQRNVISGNKVSDGALHGIGLTAGSTGCVVSNNECFRNAHPTIRQANGIYLSAAPGNTMFGNNLHHNQDTGLNWSLGSNDCVSYNNLSWLNGDHGFDHLATSGVKHRNDIAYANLIDGFSFEGNSPGGSVFNCIGSDNGIGMNPNTGQPADGSNLWVDQSSSTDFVSDHNIFWNTTTQPIVKWISMQFTTLAEFRAVTGMDLHSFQASPKWVKPTLGNFTIPSGSPAIDAAHSGVDFWPPRDVRGVARRDASVANKGAGPILFSDIGPYEYIPSDAAPIVTAPSSVKVRRGQLAVVSITVRDPNGDAIHSIIMDTSRLPKGSVSTLVPNADNTAATFTCALAAAAVDGSYTVKFTAKNLKSGSASTKITLTSALQTASSEGLSTGFEGPAIGALSLSNGYPNPSMGAVDFALAVPEASDLEWSVFDMQGRRVYSESRSMPAGHHRLKWDGLTMSRQRAANGLYFVRVRVGQTQFVRRIVRL